MKNIIIIFLITIIVSSSINSQSLEKIISQNLNARGGLKNIKAVLSERLLGNISFDGKNSGPFSVTMKRADLMREEFSLKGKTIIRILNKNSGWILNPYNTKDTLQTLSPEIIKEMKNGSDFDGPLVDNKIKGNKIKLIGKVTVEGKTAYKLMIAQKDGETRYDYIDSLSNLEIKWEGTIGSGKNKHPVESYFRNYKNVDGLMFAFEIDSDSPGSKGKQKIIFDKIEINPKLDLSIFQKSSLIHSTSDK